MSNAENGKNPFPSWEEMLKEIDFLQNNEIYITGVYRIRNRYQDQIKEKGKDFQEKHPYIKTFIKEERGTENLIIRGYAETIKEKGSVLGITPDQEDALVIVFNMDPESKVSHHASIESVNGKSKNRTEAIIKKYDVLSKSTDHLLVSETLAEKLGVAENQAIKILRIYQKTSSDISSV